MENKIVADLHNHSTFSDGEYSPEALVRHAKELGLEAIALTDHDTLKGLDRALAAGRENNIQVIPGVEVSLRFKRPYFVGTLHLLFYFMPEKLNDPAFVGELEEILSNGRGPALSKARISAINDEFGPDGKTPVLKENLTYEEISSYGDNISRRHFAQALNEKHGIKDKGEVNKLIGNDSPSYIPSGIEKDLIKPFIKKYDALTVLAHPAAGSFPGPSHYREVLPPLETIEKIYPEFLDLGIKGLEVYYPAHLPEHLELMKKWALRDHLLATGGSDCHDPEVRPLGVSGITRELFDLFYKTLSKG